MKSGSNRETIKIGGDRYIIDAGAADEYILPADTKAHLEAQLPIETDVLPGIIPEYNAGWRQQMQARVGTSYCYMPGCPKKARAKGKYCSFRHERAYQARRYRRRHTGRPSWLEMVEGKPVRFERQFPATIRVAKRKFVEHIADGVCQFRGLDNRCPSSSNPYSDPAKPRCLIYGVLSDDLLVWQGRNAGVMVNRRYTSTDGEWKQDWTPLVPIQDSTRT